MTQLVDWKQVFGRTADLLQPPADPYYDDPERFCEEVLGVRLRRYQRRVLRKLRKHRRLCVRSLHGTGKTALASYILLWFAVTRERKAQRGEIQDWKVVATASVWRQLVAYLMPEVKKWSKSIDWARLPEMKPWREGYEILTLQIKADHGGAFAAASDEPSAIEGAHADELLFLFDEAKSIPADLFDAAEGALASAGTWACVFSTPGDTSGRFYEIQRRAAGTEDWTVEHFTLEEALAEGAVTQEWVDQRRKQWGEKSALFQNRVLGQFAKQAEDSIISLTWVEEAQLRWAEYAVDQLGPVDRVACDVARGGGDMTCIARRYGQYLAELEYHGQEDTMGTVGWVAAAAEVTVKGASTPEIWVDVIGIGAGVVDRLREQGYDVEAFNASERTLLSDVSGELSFRNRRASSWWMMRELLDPANGFEVALPPDDTLTGDLTAPRWKMSSTGIQVESKDDLRKRLGRSTDAGDAAVMAFVPHEPREGGDVVTYDDWHSIGPEY